MIRFRDVLFKNRSFTLLWFSQLISNFGDRIAQMALIALVWHTTPGSSLQLAKVMSFTIIPVFVIGPVAGAWVDRLDRRNVMVVSDIVRGVLAILLALVIIWQKIFLAYVVILAIYSITRFFIVSRMAIIPEIVERDELLVANSLADTTKMIGNAIGLVVAGLLVNVQFIGAIGGFFLYSVSFFASAVLVKMIAPPELLPVVVPGSPAGTPAPLRKPRTLLAEMREGLTVMFSNADMRFVVLVFSLLMAGIGAVYCVIVTYIQIIFGNATKDLSLLMLCLLSGLLGGTVVYGKLGQGLSKKMTICYAFVATGIMVVILTLGLKYSSSASICGILAFFLGMTVSPIMVSANTLAHEVMPDEVRGKVFSSLEALMHLMFLICMFLTGFLDRYIAKAWILGGAGAAFAAVGVAGLIVARRRQRRATSC